MKENANRFSNQKNTNIIQAVKNCYKIKIDYRDFQSGFYGF